MWSLKLIVSVPDKVKGHHKRPYDTEDNLLKLGVVPFADVLVIGYEDTDNPNKQNQISIPCHSCIVLITYYFSLFPYIQA